MCVITLTAGTAFIMWLGEADHRARHWKRHVAADLYGNCCWPARGIMDIYTRRATKMGPVDPTCYRPPHRCDDWQLLRSLSFVERSERRIPVQYAKRIVGRKMMGGQSTHLPLRVNSGGVMP